MKTVAQRLYLRARFGRQNRYPGGQKGELHLMSKVTWTRHLQTTVRRLRSRLPPRGRGGGLAAVPAHLESLSTPSSLTGLLAASG